MPVERQTEYETIYVLRSDSDDEKRANVRDRVEGAVEGKNGHVLKFDDWGQRDLAYEVRDPTSGKRFDRGVYQYYRYIGPGDTVAEVERNLKLLDDVLKFMTIKIDDDLIPEERLARPEEEEPEVLPYAGEEE
ncbi:MAG: 30S ribosomal protein S6 [Persicimonas sp.]